MQNKLMLPGAILIAGTLIAVAVIYKSAPQRSASDSIKQPVTQAVLVDGGHILPLEAKKSMLDKLTEDGVIDGSKLPQVTELNLLWAYGLANRNQVLESGPIMDPRYGGPTNMASVGGWTVTTGSVMDHYNKHTLATLTGDQQALVEKIAKGIYRPCCNNSTHFPDCNHGMSMLGLLEYLAANGATEYEMWSAALTANMNWFPDAYQMIAQYMKENDIDGKSISPQEILGADYSSASGFAKISAQVKQPVQKQSGGGCGVDAGIPINTQKQQSGCGV